MEQEEIKLSIGEMIGKNKILEHIAEGGMADVYKAFYQDLEVTRAIKIIKKDQIEESGRFVTEAKVTANLIHPNIVQCHDVGTHNDCPYIVLEYIDGADLADLIISKEKIPSIVSLCFLLIICEGLKYAHNCEYVLFNEKRKGIIHRDIKPENILLSNDGSVKISDFGIVKIENVSVHTTTMSSMIGTYPYMAPEQMKRSVVDKRADVYSLGCVLYEMITGEQAFGYDNVGDIVLKKEENDYSCEEFNKIPNEVKRIIDKMIEVDLKKRYQDIESVIKDTNRYLKKEGISNHQEIVENYIKDDDFTVKSRKKRVPLVLILTVLAIAVISIFLYQRVTNKTETEKRDKTSDKQAITWEKEEGSLQSSNEKKKELKKRVKDDGVSLKPVLREKPKVRKKEVGRKVDYLGLLKKKRYKECVLKTKGIYNKNDTAFLCYTGSLIETGRFNEVKNLLFIKNISDGYYFYLRGRYSYNYKNYKNAEKMFITALTKKSMLDIKKDTKYYLTKNAIDDYKIHPNKSKKEIMILKVEDYQERYCSDESNNTECEEFKSILVGKRD